MHHSGLILMFKVINWPKPDNNTKLFLFVYFVCVAVSHFVSGKQRNLHYNLKDD